MSRSPRIAGEITRGAAAGAPRLLAVAALVAFCTLAAAQGSSLQRPHDPAVLTGADLPALAGSAPAGLAAFRYGPGGWVQVPLQVDQRAVVAFDDVYGPAVALGSALTVLTYADPDTYTGADPDPAFDDDDELVVMASDAGGRAPATAVEPLGALPASGVELELVDPLDGGRGYLYLFRHGGGLDPAAGEDRVDYDFGLLSGSYLASYNTALGPNPEDSVVTSASYGLRFVDRWVLDDLWITAGSASGVDLLDRHKYLFQPGQCARTEETFSAGPGAFLANVDGPLRAVRSVMGANSGPISQRDQLFYAGRHDLVSYVRVHELTQGGLDFLDYSVGAVGMVHANDGNPTGVQIDGLADAFGTKAPRWELTAGVQQGTLSIAHWAEASFSPIAIVGYYEDALAPPQVQCTGDPYEYGASGPWVVSPTPNTDPLNGPAEELTVYRTHYYDPPAPSVALAAVRADLLARQARTPLEVNTAAFAPCAVMPHCTAGTSAAGCQALLSATGSASASAPSGFVVDASGVEGQHAGLFYYGSSGSQAAPWGNGTSFQCVVPPVKRCGLLAPGGTAGGCDGAFSQDLNAFWTAFPAKRPEAGEVVDLELWYRDPLSTSNQSTSLSNALRFCVGP